MTDETHPTRRSFTKALASTAVLATVPLAGCSSGDGGNGDDDATTTESGGNGGGDADFGGWFDDVSNYDGVEDRTGTDTTTVRVGTQANGGAYGFDPAAIRVSTGTTVQFEWTGEGGQHNVSEEGGAFESDMVAEAGVNFEHTFDEAGTYKYVCTPHEALGMKGAIVVE